ncbi:MAG: competence/damage-inducible protein A [Gemmatimonadetes bacterium]|nr:competence/damage-inducible protein A [Gemmatimonadota bacterium]
MPPVLDALEVVTIGDELLLGFTIDTNAAHLARELGADGVRIVRRATCGDDAAAIAEAVRDAVERTGAVITTGGLGPTSDDNTKAAIAALFGRAMYFDETVWQGIVHLWKSRGWPGEVPESNKLQAWIPEGATILHNRHGSAPGIWLEDDQGRWVAMLPGVPREMRGMLADTIRPRLAEKRGARAATVIRSRTIRTTGIGESALHDKLGDARRGLFGLPLAFLPGWEGTDLRLTARGLPASEADATLDRAEAELRARAGDVVYGTGDDDLAAVVLDLLRARGWRAAVAESCTGGMLGMRLTAIAGSSDVMLGGVIAYHNQVKVRDLGVSEADLAAHGAVSEAVVRQMAAGVRARTGAEVGLAVTGIAGPGGGTPDKPVGTVWLAVETPDGARTSLAKLIGDRDEVRRRATQGVLNLLRKALTP